MHKIWLFDYINKRGSATDCKKMKKYKARVADIDTVKHAINYLFFMMRHDT